MDGASQREWLKSTDGEIFHQAKTHKLLPVFPVNWKAAAAISDAIRDVFTEENGLVRGEPGEDIAEKLEGG